MDIPGYVIQRAIGKGGMGTVYLATQESLERLVVLKTMGIADVQSTEFLERFLNEGRIVAALGHPHVITIYDIGTAEDVLFISMEFVEGGDLKEKIQDRVPPVVALDIISKIGSALAFAHEEGIIHRDVKPANILFRRDGTPLLSDFGIAKQTRVDSELTSTGTILGSPFYMSPEQAEGLDVDGRTDIYSLGVIFFEMLVGCRPYDGESPIKVIVQHIQAPVPRLPRALKRFQPLLNRMMAKNRDERFQDAAELVRHVRMAQQQEAEAVARAERQEATPPPAPAQAPRRRVPDWLPARRNLVLLGSALVLVVAGLAGFYAWTLSLESPTFVAPRPPPVAAVPPTQPPPEQAPAPDGTAPEGTAAAGTESTTPEPPPDLQREDVIRALEWLGRNSLQDDRLTAPEGDNALYYYTRLQTLDPESTEAARGLSSIAERFVVLAEGEYSRNNLAKAQLYIDQGLEIQPGNAGLLALQDFIRDRGERSFVDSLLDFFRD